MTFFPSQRRQSTLVAAALLFSSAVSLQMQAQAAPRQFNVTVFSERGDSGLHLRAVTLESLDGTRRPADLSKVKSSFAIKGDSKVTLKADWGVVETTFHDTDDALNIETIVTNTGPDIIRGLDLQLLTITFPGTPKNFNGDPRLTHNRDTPAMIQADFGDSSLFFTNDLPGRAVIFGFPYSTDKPANKTYPLIFSTQQIGWLQGPNLLDPYLDRPIYPGGSDRFRFSCRVGNDGGLSGRFAAQLPPILNWKDRRPIGMVMLSSSDEAGKSPTNPRGWFHDTKVDVFSEAGRAAFRKRVLDQARECVRILKDMNAQGAVVWDTEGQEFPHATSYLGDPRSLPPEMESIADEFFKTFIDAGLKIGICIRPQQPIRRAYGGPVEQVETPDPAQTLIDKISYAKKRWGATLFYVDSNGDPNVPFDAAIFEKTLRAHPDVLLLPEHQAARYYRSSAPYDELRGGIVGTPDSIRKMYPRAFGVIVVSDGDTKAHRKELVRSVKAGDILMSRVWFDDTYNAEVKSIYEEANKK